MNRKWGVWIGVGVLCAFLFPSLALAAVGGTAHDIITKYTALPKKSGTCSFCHVPHNAAGARLWPTSLDNSVTTGWRADAVSQMCWSCHNPTSSYTEAQEVNPFGTTNKHQRDGAIIEADGDITSFPPAGVTVASGKLMKCTSCHDVHSNDYRPFLNRLDTTNQTTTNWNAFCTKCHPLRLNKGNYGAANTGNHPMDQLISATQGRANIVASASVNAAFTVAMSTLTDKVGGAWNLGGHMSDGLGNATAGNFNCATCHAVHGNETTDFTASDGATGVTTEQTGNNNLLVMAGVPGTTVTPICTGCHGGTYPYDGTAGNNPGAGATFSHPVGTVDNGAWTTNVDTLTQGYKWGTVSTKALLDCQSCHDIHFPTTITGTVGKKGAGATNAYLQKWTCDDCHVGSTVTGHHPSNVTPSSGVAMTGNAKVNSTMVWSTRTLTPGTTAYSFPGGKVICSTCHAGAHNRSSWPGLTSTDTYSEMCVECHTVNPSVRTANVHSGTGSGTVTDDATHFVGGIVTTGYKRTANFSSGAAPKYAPIEGTATNGSIICESCHTLKFKTVTPKSSTNTAVSGKVSATVGLLLEASGNLNTAYDTTTTTPKTGTGDLCTGCHGVAPGTGSTHPVQTMTANATMTPVAGTGVTLSSTGGKVNCESCHRPHDAAPGSGATILETVGTDSVKATSDLHSASNYTNTGTLCVACHNTK